MKAQKSKKANLSMELVVKYLLAFAAFFVLALFIANFLGIIGGQGTEQACRTTVIARDKVEIGKDGSIKQIEHIIPLNCPPQDVTLPTVSTTRLNDEEIRDAFQKDIADLMAQCWWMYANGQITEVFGERDSGNKDNDPDKIACGVCYTFYIPTSYGNDEDDPLRMPFFKSDIETYLSTHNYAPGLLQGGGALPTRTKIINYQEQTHVPTSFTRTLTRERFFASRRALEGNIADLTNIYSQNYDSFTKLEDALDIMNEAKLQVSFVIVPELVGEDFKDYNNIGIELIDEWDLGSPDLFNGIVFLFSLQDGILVYAAQNNAEAVLPQATIEEILAESEFHELMEIGILEEEAKPHEAILSFAEKLAETIGEMGSEEISSKIQFQQSYLSYITGGLAEPPLIGKGTEINIQGAIRWSDKTFEMPEDIILPSSIEEGSNTFAIGAGYRYAIIYLSYDNEYDFIRRADKDLSGSLAVVYADEAIAENDAYCRIKNY